MLLHVNTSRVHSSFQDLPVPSPTVIENAPQPDISQQEESTSSAPVSDVPEKSTEQVNQPGPVDCDNAQIATEVDEEPELALPPHDTAPTDKEDDSPSEENRSSGHGDPADSSADSEEDIEVGFCLI